MIEPIFERATCGERCINAGLVLHNIQDEHPHETYSTLAMRAGVHSQTIQRWHSGKNAEAKAIRSLLASFTFRDNSNVLLKDATPSQLYQRCSEIGWDKIIKKDSQ